MAGVEEILRNRSSVKRIIELDSLRGIAACIVVLCHLRAPFVATELKWYLRPIFDGHVSVIIFFVLSGYVLSLPFWLGTQLPYSKYLIRRFFRIYVPYAVAVCCSLIAGMNFLDSQLPLTKWFYICWHTPFTLRLIASQFLTIDTAGRINIAFWSLRYEMEMSIAIPLICMFVRRLSVRMALLLSFAIELVGFGGLHLFKDTGLGREVSTTIVWSSCFLLGALLAKERKTISKKYGTFSRPIRVALAACSVAMFYFGHDEVAIPGACLIIVLVQNSRAREWLQHPIPEYLGRISYSLYLLHGAIILSLTVLFYGRIPLWALVSLCLALSVAMSHFFCLLVEEPAMRIGKRLAKSFQKANDATEKQAMLQS